MSNPKKAYFWNRSVIRTERSLNFSPAKKWELATKTERKKMKTKFLFLENFCFFSYVQDDLSINIEANFSPNRKLCRESIRRSGARVPKRRPRLVSQFRKSISGRERTEVNLEHIRNSRGGTISRFFKKVGERSIAFDPPYLRVPSN